MDRVPSAPAGLDPDVLLRQLRAAVARSCPDWLRSEREDLAQSAAVRILEALERTPGATLNATYVWKTAWSVLADETRRAHRRRERALEPDVSETRAGDGPDPARRLESARLGEALRACLSGLDPGRRRAVQLRLAGFGHEESGEMLGRTVKQVSNLVHRGMQDLRRCLSGKGYGG